jgi:hypothetical protein
LQDKKRVGLIVCEIFFREISYLVAQHDEIVDVVYMPKGLHDLGGEKMREILQGEIDKMNEKDYDRIILYYALCNLGTANLTTSKVPLIIPKAHDCITLFLGSREKYTKYFYENSGTYFHTTGWVERGGGDGQYFDSELGPEMNLNALIEKYGEENGKYLWETLNPSKNYHKIAYIHIPLPGLPDVREESKRIAEENGWEWEEVEGDPTLIKQLLSGPYPEDLFVTVKPNQRSFATHDDEVLGAG